MTAMHEYLVTSHRDNGETFTMLADDRPEWLQDAVMAAHDDEMPNDWRYNLCALLVAALDEITEYRDDVDGFRDHAVETIDADNYTDVYTDDLIGWMNSARTTYADQVIADYGANPGTTLADVLIAAQHRCIEGMVSVLADAYAENVIDQ